MSGKTSRNQTRAIAALLEYPTITAAAEVVGVNEKTVRRWLADPGFKVALANAEADKMNRSGRRLLVMVDGALDTLQDILDDPQAGTSDQRLAAVSILDQVLKIRTAASVEERLQALEAIINNGNGEQKTRQS